MCRCADNTGSQELAHICETITGGNPFFLIQLMRSLYESGVFNFSTTEGRWTWNIATLRSAKFSENAVELVAGKIVALPEDTQRLLKIGMTLFKIMFLLTSISELHWAQV